MRPQPIGQSLALGRFGKRIVTGSQAGDKDLYRSHFAGDWMGERQGHPTIIPPTFFPHLDRSDAWKVSECLSIGYSDDKIDITDAPIAPV